MTDSKHLQQSAKTSVAAMDSSNTVNALKNTDEKIAGAAGESNIFFLLTLLLMNLFGYAANSFPIPFFSTIATKHALGESQVGLIFASFDLAKLLLAPLSFKMVSTINVA